MKAKILIGTAVLLTALCPHLTGCSQTDKEYQYIRILETTYSFLGSDNEPKVIRIEASPEWTAKSSSSWIYISDQTENSLTITVQDNDSDTEREGKIMLAAGNAYAEIFISQLPQRYDLPIYNTYGSYDMGAAMSPDGHYCVGTFHELQEDGSYMQTPTFFDLHTGDITKVGPIHNSLFKLEKPMAVTNQGTAFIIDANGGTVAITVDGDTFKPQAPEGWKQNAHVQGVSEDGRIWVGYACEKPGVSNRPVMWIDGQPQPLEMPETSVRGGLSNYCLARGCSSDGSIIYGTQWEDLTCGMVYWVDGKLKRVGEDIFKRETVMIENGKGNLMEYNIVTYISSLAQLNRISPNGKWIAGEYTEETLGPDNQVNIFTCPAFYNTETETTTVFRDYGGCGVSTVTDDGIGIITNTNYGPTSGFMVDIESGTKLQDCLSWIKDNMGITVTSGYISRFATDGKTVLGNMPVESAGLGLQFTQFSVSPRPEE